MIAGERIFALFDSWTVGLWRRLLNVTRTLSGSFRIDGLEVDNGSHVVDMTAMSVEHIRLPPANG